MRLIALLPMKAHSERIPGKNFKVFAGRPLFRWTLDTLLSINQIDQIVINTDAREILAANGLLESSRILIRDRKPDLCGDFVSMNKIIEDDINEVEAEAYLMTHTTNPLLSTETVKLAIDAYSTGLLNGYDSLFSVNRFQTRFYRDDASPVNHDPNKLLRTQDLEVWFEENSNIYLFSRDSFKSTNSRIGARPLLFQTPHLESADIDDATGWHLAEIIAHSRMLAESSEQFSRVSPQGVPLH